MRSNGAGFFPLITQHEFLKHLRRVISGGCEKQARDREKVRRFRLKWIQYCIQECQRCYANRSKCSVVFSNSKWGSPSSLYHFTRHSAPWTLIFTSAHHRFRNITIIIDISHYYDCSRVIIVNNRSQRLQRPHRVIVWMLMIARNNILICFNISSNDYFYVDFYHRALVTLSRFYWLLIPTLGREERREKIRRMEKSVTQKISRCVARCISQ